MQTLTSNLPHDIREEARMSIGGGFLIPVGSTGCLEVSMSQPVFGNRTTDVPQMLQIGIRLSGAV